MEVIIKNTRLFYYNRSKYPISISIGGINYALQ